MKRFFVGFMAFAALMFGSAIVAPSASAATENVLGYYHSGYQSQLFAFGLTSGTCNQEGYTWTLNSTQMGNLSSVRLTSGTGVSRCNWMSVMNVNGHWWGKCIRNSDNGINWFGSDFNDRTLKVHVSRRLDCPSYNH
jgi:hypothetical protein